MRELRWLRAGGLLMAVVLDVEFCRFGGVMRGVMVMTMSRMGMVSGGFMAARFVVLGGFVMMPGGVLVVLGCFAMMLCCLLGHGSSWRGLARTG